MRDPRQPSIASSRLILGLLVVIAVAPTARAGAEDLVPAQAAPISTAEAAAPLMTGPQVYDAVCIACHAPPSVGGAPALGDGEAWAARIDQGADTLIDHALHGYSGKTGLMPGKGGRLDLSDEEVIRAVEYMLEQAAR